MRLVEMVVKVVDSFVPTAVTAPIMTTAMSAAIKPYSIAVAPLSFPIKRIRVLIEPTPEIFPPDGNIGTGAMN